MLRVFRSFVAAVACWLAPLPAIAGPALLYDANTGQVLFAESPDHPRFPASLAKRDGKNVEIVNADQAA